nr:SPOR domain-containing protein [Microbacterium bovistercoris]
MAENDDKFWFNLVTGEVERGMQAPAPDRAGPFDTAEEAARAPEVIRDRSRKWAEEERREDDWGSDGTAAGDEG